MNDTRKSSDFYPTPCYLWGTVKQKSSGKKPTGQYAQNKVEKNKNRPSLCTKVS